MPGKRADELSATRPGRPTSARGVGGLTDGRLESLVHLGGLGIAHPDPLLTRALAAHELDPATAHAKQLGHKPNDGLVGLPVLGWGGHPHPEGVTVATHHPCPARPGLDTETEHDVISALLVAGPGDGHYLEQVLGHVAIL